MFFLIINHYQGSGIRDQGSRISDYSPELGYFIFVPSINLIKKIIIITVGRDFEGSKIDYMSVYGFVMFFIGSIGMRIYLKFFDKE